MSGLIDLDRARGTGPANSDLALTPTAGTTDSETASPTLKLFVTGCPRSGTTLLQSILADAASVHTLKETHFFKHLMRRRPLRWIDRHIALNPRRLQDCFEFITEHNGLERPQSLNSVRFLGEACSLFDELLCQSARSKGLHGWLEKTPEHMFFIDDIRRHIPGARFVHILRHGPDVVASLVDAKRKYPKEWGWIGSLGATVRLYNRYLKVIHEEQGASDTFILRYEDLIDRNQRTMTALEQFLDLQNIHPLLS